MANLSENNYESPPNLLTNSLNENLNTNNKHSILLNDNLEYSCGKFISTVALQCILAINLEVNTNLQKTN